MRLLKDYEHIEHVERCRARERRLGFFNCCRVGRAVTARVECCVSKSRCVEESTAQPGIFVDAIHGLQSPELDTKAYIMLKHEGLSCMFRTLLASRSFKGFKAKPRLVLACHPEVIITYPETLVTVKHASSVLPRGRQVDCSSTKPEESCGASPSSTLRYRKVRRVTVVTCTEIYYLI